MGSGVMEHRFGVRHPLGGRLTLRNPGQGAVTGRLREASISGMFVETAPEFFACHTVVDVEMVLPATAGLRSFRWQAMVIRRTVDGVGLMFDRVRPPAITRLLATAKAMELPELSTEAVVVPITQAAGPRAAAH